MSQALDDVREAIDRGDQAQARDLLGELLVENPYDSAAWRLLAEVATDPAQRAEALQRAEMLGFTPAKPSASEDSAPGASAPKRSKRTKRKRRRNAAAATRQPLSQEQRLHLVIMSLLLILAVVVFLFIL